MDAAARGLQSRSVLEHFNQLPGRCYPQGQSISRESRAEGRRANSQQERWNDMVLPMSYDSLAKIPRDFELNGNDLCRTPRSAVTGLARSGHGDVGDGWPVMMSQEEEEEFAEYLFLKRENVRRLQWHGRNE